MTSLKSNLIKRVERLPKPTNVAIALQPLFEAISNSIHSTQAKFGDHASRRGKVTVTVGIDRSKRDFWATVEDNGLGVNSANWEAFLTTDTDNKIAIGGKGVGRLLWLDCFEYTQISSIYETTAGRKERRMFSFISAVDEQIQHLETESVPSSAETDFFCSISRVKR